MEAYNADNVDMRECIRRFDGALSIKANKDALKIMKRSMEKVFINDKKWEVIVKDVEGFRNEMKLDVAAMGEKVQTFMEDEKDNYPKTIERLMRTNLIRYEEVYDQFKKFFCEGDLEERFEVKADWKYIEELEATKAAKEDVLHTQNLIFSLNERVKHLSIIQAETAGALIPIRNALNSFNEETRTSIY